jgi:hypothetical protein
LTAAGADVSVGSATNMQANMAILYTLLLNLTSASYGKNYTDPVERTEAASYTELCRSDVSFKQETEDCKKAIDDLITAHGTYKTAIGNHTWSGGFSRTTGTNGKTYVQCIEGSTAGTDGVKSAKKEITNYRDGITNRISEISNRIGYLNGKNTASGGGSFVSSEIDYLLLNGTDSSSTDAGDNILCEDALSNALVQTESTISASISAGSMGDGFAGYSFNGGLGYANTIYSHANFLAGKKINLLGKVLKAIVAVQEMYDSVTRKRSEYYEYNQ